MMAVSYLSVIGLQSVRISPGAARPCTTSDLFKEFVDIAAAFFPEGKESRFVNAVLDHVAREAKPEAF